MDLFSRKLSKYLKIKVTKFSWILSSLGQTSLVPPTFARVPWASSPCPVPAARSQGTSLLLWTLPEGDPRGSSGPALASSR